MFAGIGQYASGTSTGAAGAPKPPPPKPPPNPPPKLNAIFPGLGACMCVCEGVCVVINNSDF